MSKLTKLIKNPKQFFVDSIYFGYANVKLVDIDNLFIVTTFAQLKNIENLIRLEGLKNNYLLVLYTNANLKMPRLILKNVDRSLFEVIDKFKLPIKPGSVDIVKARYFIRSYQRLISGILPTSLYLFSFEGHYTILRNIAKSNSIKIIIVEEGTASYKDLKLMGFENKNFTHKEEIIKKLPFCQDVFGYIDKADVIYSAFPELMLSQFEATNSVTFIHPLFASFRASSKDLITKYNINSNDGIYVNQKYHIDMEDHTNSVINILMEIAKKSNNRIFVKMHPNDSPKLKDLFRSRISEMPSNLICFIDEESFLIEALLAELKPNMLIGLTSTSLVYSSLISPKTKNVTIAKEFLNRVESNSKNIVGCNTINVHLDILKKFNNLTEYGAGEFYPLLNKDNKHHIYEDYIFYKIIDYKDYFFEKYMSDLNGADFSNIEEWLYLRFYSVQNISEEDIIWFENYDYQVLLKNDNSL
ncbi:MAG: alpha-2,8-polysialyltransferase family protein, partial [Pseudomonadota bacterium]|nr:alpha-2,8-polysialyltransferase family protein [Pseudomonadota bacterium]